MAGYLLSMALLIAAQINPAKPPNPAAPKEQCTISGTVLSAATGQPLRDAAVTLYTVGARGSPLTVATNAGGQYEIRNVSPGRYSLAASHPGYVRTEYGQQGGNGPGRLLALSPGQTASHISFRLLREAVITGHVYNEDGEPIEDAQVRAMRYRFYQGKRRLMPRDSATTDDRGKYRLYGLAPGSYYVSASTSLMNYGSPFTYAPSYYPGVADASQASPITLRAGNEFPGVDITLRRIGSYHIRGRVIGNIAKTPVSSVFVQTITRTGPNASFGRGGIVKDARGDFDISGVRPGSYFVIAQITLKGALYQARQPVTVTDSDVNGLRLVLTPGATLKGVVRTEGSVDLSKTRVYLRPRDGVFFGSYSSPAINPDGTFEFDSLADGGHLLDVFGLPRDAYVKSATLGGRDVLGSGFEITNGEAPGSTLKIVVSANGARVSGTVLLDGKLFNDALVTLLPAQRSKLGSDWWFKSTTTDQYGSFTLTGIRPGDYRLFAWQKIKAGEEREPDFLDQFKDQGLKLQVAPGAMLSVRLNAIPAGKVQAAEAR